MKNLTLLVMPCDKTRKVGYAVNPFATEGLKWARIIIMLSGGSEKGKVILSIVNAGSSAPGPEMILSVSQPVFLIVKELSRFPPQILRSPKSICAGFASVFGA